VNTELHIAEQIRLWLTALSTPALAAFAGWIALQQYRLQHYRLRLDLSQRRFAVFVATRNFALTAVTKLQASDEALLAFDAATAEAPFLFGSDVTEYLSALREGYCELLAIADQRQTHENDAAESRRLGSDWAMRRQWFRDELKRAQDVFRPSLDLSKA